MKLLDLTLSTPEENIACDEALLDSREDSGGSEVLRFWESRRPFAVLGYSNKAADVLHLDACREDRVPVLRRPSGGGTVLQGPGCLSYALILKIDSDVSTITDTNRYVMAKNCEAVKRAIDCDVRIEGHTDLALGDLKFSGNSQRRKMKHLLFHGTFLLEFDIDGIGRYLNFPSRQPRYRLGRSHAEFLTNLHVHAEILKDEMKKIWKVSGETEPPMVLTQKLVADRYARDEWNLRF